MSKKKIFVLMYHGHKLLDLIHLVVNVFDFSVFRPQITLKVFELLGNMMHLG
jgi:hypothetical protein